MSGEMQQMNKMDEFAKALDVLLKENDTLKDVILYLDSRIEKLEKASDFEDEEDEEEEADEEDKEQAKIPTEEKKFAEGVPTKGLANGTGNEAVKSGKANDIDQTIKEDAKLEGAKTQALTGGGAAFTPHKAEVQVLKSYQDAVKVGEMNALKKMADSIGVETPVPGQVSEPNRDMSPLSKSDTELLNMPFGKIERRYREGKLV